MYYWQSKFQIPNSKFQKKSKSKLKFRPLFLQRALPHPLLSTRALNPTIDPPQLECEAGPEFLQSGTNALDAFDVFPIGPHDAFFRGALVAEDVAMASYEDVVALVMQRDDLAAL